MSTKPLTMFEKIWNHHIVHAEEGKQTILYIDLQLVHEVTSPQAFEGLRMNHRQVRRTDKTFAVPDHNVPTTDRSLPIKDEIAKKQIDTLRQNAHDFGVTLFDVGDPRQGVCHVMGPEQGHTKDPFPPPDGITEADSIPWSMDLILSEIAIASLWSWVT